MAVFIKVYVICSLIDSIKKHQDLLPQFFA